MFSRHFAHWPPGLPHEIEVPAQSVYQNLVGRAERTPDAAALYYYGRTLSYAETRREVERLAGYLQQRCGVAKGERVILYLQNSPQFVIAYYAVLRADAVVVPVNPMNLTEELRHYVEDAEARVAIAGQDRLAQILPLVGKGLERIVVATYGDYYMDAGFPVPELVRAPRELPSRDGVVAWRDAL